jgi:acylaminoacyl-peptidase
MVITGEQDYRAPSGEAEQFYSALKLRKVPSAMLRIPDASHSIDAKGSNIVAQIVYTIDWFDKYRGKMRAPE